MDIFSDIFVDTVFLSKTKLFSGLSPKEIEDVLHCLDATLRKYHKGDIIYSAGERISKIGLLLNGGASVENNDIWGNRNILDSLTSGKIFGENYAFLPEEPLMVNVVANRSCEVMFLNVQRLVSENSCGCGAEQKLLKNLVQISASKSLNLSRRIFHTSAKTIRGRLLSYLSYQALLWGSTSFDIPFNRQELADYLSVDRSAMSFELSKMQKEGILKTTKNHFSLHSDED